jgi:hypothetical protein
LVLLWPADGRAESLLQNAIVVAEQFLPGSAAPVDGDRYASGYGAGPRFCDAYGGLSASGVGIGNVFPCANREISNAFGFECVEFSRRFEWAVHAQPLGGDWSGKGRDLVDAFHSQDGAGSSTNAR